jgi:hypothetical protein
MAARFLFTFFLLWALPAAAAEGPSVVVIEGVSLPEHLDAFHARARDALMKVVERAGWRPVDGGPAPCRDAGCAGTVAGRAGAGFVLIADGKYRTGGYDLRVQLWNGREMVVDQSSCEDCTGPEFVARLEAIAAPLIEGHKSKLLSAPPPPTTAAVTPPLPLAPPPTDRGYLAPVGWAALIAGAGAAAGGAYLLWSDGQLEHCVDTSAGTRNCSRERVTHGGWPLVAGGAALAALGGGLLVYRHVAARSQVSVLVGPSSLAFSGSF